MVLALILIACIFVLVVTFFSKTHGLGIWLLMMIVHGIIYQYLGKGTEHLPLFAGIAVLLVILLRRQWRGISRQLTITLVLLIVVMALASAFGINHVNSLITMLMYTKGFFLVVLLAGSLREEREIKTITLYLLFGLTIGGIFAVFQQITGTFTVNSLYVQRAAGLRGDPNDTAMLLLAGVPIALYWLLNSTRAPFKLLSTG